MGYLPAFEDGGLDSWLWNSTSFFSLLSGLQQEDSMTLVNRHPQGGDLNEIV